MKTVPALSLFFLFALVAPRYTYCQGTETPVQKIKRMEEMERSAIVTGNTDMLFKLWSDDYVVNNPNNTVLTAEQIKSSIRGGGMRSVSYVKNIEKITFIKDMAIVMGSEIVSPKDKYDNDGKNTIRRYTNIWIKADTSWRLSARQATNIIVQ